MKYFAMFCSHENLKKILMIAWTLLLCFPAVTLSSKRMFNIYWNTTNPMFRIDNTDNVIDVNTGNLPWEYDQANIICPLYRKGTRAADVEKYIIYNVSREEYENCQITSPNPRVIAICDKPHDLIYFTITFRSFTPTPGGLEFKPGKDYYFVSTSSRSDLYRRLGGRCSSHNMRVVFKVADNPMETTASPGKSDVIAVNVPRQVAPPVENNRKTDLNAEDEAQSKLSDLHSYLYPTRDVIELDSNSVEHEKRSEEYDKQPNEVIKQAPMTSSSSRLVTSTLATQLLLVLTVVSRVLTFQVRT